LIIGQIGDRFGKNKWSGIGIVPPDH